MRPEPELVTIIRRLADLEQQDQLAVSELDELNALRVRLFDTWPQVGAVLARAYVSVRRD